MRGRFLSIDQFFMYGGCLVSLLASALVMAGPVQSWEYALVFLISALGGTISLGFIKRIPEVEADKVTRRNSENVPWREMLAFPPFRELLVFNLIYATVLGSLGVFTVEFLRDFSYFDVGSVLYLSAFSFVGALLALPFCGPLVDATGSKPLMRVATVMFGLVIVAWSLIAAGVVRCSLALVAALNFFAGAASANFNLANVRITLATMPEMGRNHFFALFTVITSLGLGGVRSPGARCLTQWEATRPLPGCFTGNGTIYFVSLFALVVIAFAYIPRLYEAGHRRRRLASLAYTPSKRSVGS